MVGDGRSRCNLPVVGPICLVEKAFAEGASTDQAQEQTQNEIFSVNVPPLSLVFRT